MDVSWNTTAISAELNLALRDFNRLFGNVMSQNTSIPYYAIFAPQNLKCDPKKKADFYTLESTINDITMDMRGAEYDEDYVQVKELKGEIIIVRHRNKETIKFLEMKNELVEIFHARFMKDAILDMREIVRFFNIIGCAHMVMKRLKLVLAAKGIHKDGNPMTKRIPHLYDFGNAPASLERLFPNGYKGPMALFKTYQESLKRSAKGLAEKKKIDNEGKMTRQLNHWFSGNGNMLRQIALQPSNKETRRSAESFMTSMMGIKSNFCSQGMPSTVTLRSLTVEDKSLRSLMVESISRDKELYALANMEYTCSRLQYALLIYLIDTGMIYDHEGVTTKCSNYNTVMTLDHFKVIKNTKSKVNIIIPDVNVVIKAVLFPKTMVSSSINLGQGQTVFNYREGATSSKKVLEHSRISYLSQLTKFKETMSLLPTDPYMSADTDNAKETTGKLVKVEDFSTEVEIPFVDRGFLTNVKPITNLKKELEKEEKAKAENKD